VFSQEGIGIKGVQTFHDKVSGTKRGKNIVYNFRIDGLNVCHCGDLGHLLSLEQINEIGKVDILLLPIGGRVTLDASGAAEVMKQLNPAVVIPMHYRTKAMGILGFIFGKVDTFITVSKKDAKNYKELDVNLSNIKDLPGIAVLQYN
jgi:L-ascorbate metabolism protein UlaG (beta-lactamase superfamily)